MNLEQIAIIVIGGTAGTTWAAGNGGNAKGHIYGTSWAANGGAGGGVCVIYGENIIGSGTVTCAGTSRK